MALAGALPSSRGAAASFLEAHYFDGGLQTKALSAGRRPTWAPNADRVGFRGEFVLDADDLVVEHCRLRPARRDLSWLALYRRSVDTVHGDRQNYAGIGVWLLGLRIVDPVALLRGLRKMVAIVDAGSLPQLETNAHDFSERFLPRYVEPEPPLPAELTGWSHATSPLPASGLFAAGADEPAAWIDVGEHLLRMQFLPDPKERSRAVLLISGNAGKPIRATGEVEMLERNVALQLANRIGPAFSDVAARLEASVADKNANEATIGQLKADNAVLEQKLEAAIAVEASPVDTPVQPEYTEILRRIRTVEDISNSILALVNNNAVRPYIPQKMTDHAQSIYRSEFQTQHNQADRHSYERSRSIAEWALDNWVYLLLGIALISFVTTAIYFFFFNR